MFRSRWLIALAAILGLLLPACREAWAQVEAVQQAPVVGLPPDYALLDWAATRFGMPGALLALGFLVMWRFKGTKLAIPMAINGPVEMRLQGHPDCPWRAGKGDGVTPEERPEGHR